MHYHPETVGHKPHELYERTKIGLDIKWSLLCQVLGLCNVHLSSISMWIIIQRIHHMLVGGFDAVHDIIVAISACINKINLC